MSLAMPISTSLITELSVTPAQSSRRGSKSQSPLDDGGPRDGLLQAKYLLAPARSNRYRAALSATVSNTVTFTMKASYPNPSRIYPTLAALGLLRTLALVVLVAIVGSARAGVVITGGGLALVEEGGAIRAENVAAGKTPFASGVIPVAPHTIAGLNDQTFGNSSSWIGNYGGGGFAGINLGATPVTLHSIAFGRDNTGVFTDRSLGIYTLQYTTVPNPDAATTAWTTIGTIDYQSAGGTNFTFPAGRHRFIFTPVSATGIRLVLSGDDIGIDELELYGLNPVITTNADSGPGSLRQAVLDSAEVPGPTTLTFAPALNGATLTVLSTIAVETLAGVSSSVTVDATALPAGLTLDGGGNTRIMRATTGRGLTLRGLTFTNGRAPTGEGGGFIYCSGSVVNIARCVFTGNQGGTGIYRIDNNGLSGGPGGAINSFSCTLTVTDCTFSGNKAGNGATGGFGFGIGGIAGKGGAGGQGGAIYAVLGTVTLTNCTFSGNRSGDGGPMGAPYNTDGSNGGYGGAIYCASGALNMSRCTLTDNRTGDGSNSSFQNQFYTSVGGFGGDGGAIYTTGNTTTISHCTIVGNTCGAGGTNGNGTYRSNGTGGGVFVNFNTSLNLSNSIVALNTGAGAGDLFNFGTTAFAGANILQQLLIAAGSTSGPTPIASAPLLAPLGNYGGPTMSMPLLPGSPARNAAVGSTSSIDERGFPIVGTPDIGAYEAGTITGYNIWNWETLPATATAPQRASTFDYEQDGRNNLLEYATLTDGGIPNGGTPLAFTRNAANGEVTVTFPTRFNAADLGYTIERTTALGGTWTTVFTYNGATNVGTPIAGVSAAFSAIDTTLTDTSVTGEQSVLYRMIVTQQ